MLQKGVAQRTSAKDIKHLWKHSDVGSTKGAKMEGSVEKADVI